MPLKPKDSVPPALPNVHSEVKQVAEEWFDTILHGVGNLSRESAAETIWEQYAELLDRGVELFRRLRNISNCDAPLFSGPLSSMTTPVTPDAGATDNGSQHAGMILTGAAVHAKATRYAAFSEQCLDMPPPALTPLQEDSIPEMLFQPLDSFLQLSTVFPGSHGWVFVFREDLAKWLISTHRFRLAYWSAEKRKTLYGVYSATSFREGDMAGPEFTKLDASVRTAIITCISQSPPGSNGYKTIEESFNTSRRTLSCILLRCVYSLTAPSRLTLLSRRASAAEPSWRTASSSSSLTRAKPLPASAQPSAARPTSRTLMEVAPRPGSATELAWPPRAGWPARLPQTQVQYQPFGPRFEHLSRRPRPIGLNESHAINPIHSSIRPQTAPCPDTPNSSRTEATTYAPPSTFGDNTGLRVPLAPAIYGSVNNTPSRVPVPVPLADGWYNTDPCEGRRETQIYVPYDIQPAGFQNHALPGGIHTHYLPRRQSAPAPVQLPTNIRPTPPYAHVTPQPAPYSASAFGFPRQNPPPAPFLHRNETPRFPIHDHGYYSHNAHLSQDQIIHSAWHHHEVPHWRVENGIFPASYDQLACDPGRHQSLSVAQNN